MTIKDIDPDLKSHFLNLYSMALCDTEIDTTELEELYKIGIERGVDRSIIEQLILNPDTVKFVMPASLSTKIEYLFDFARIIVADTRIDPYEVKSLEMFCSKFGFLEENVSSIAQFLINEAKKGTAKDMVLELVNKSI